MRYASVVPVFLLLLGSSDAAPSPAGRAPAEAKRQPSRSCAMPASGAPTAAARAAAARGDHRLLAYWQNGFAVMLVTPGVRSCDADASPAPRAHNRAFRFISVSIDRARSPRCCDIPWKPDACGVRQEDYAAAYNLEMVRVARRRLACRELLMEPGRR